MSDGVLNYQSTRPEASTSVKWNGILWKCVMMEMEEQNLIMVEEHIKHILLLLYGLYCLKCQEAEVYMLLYRCNAPEPSPRCA